MMGVLNRVASVIVITHIKMPGPNVHTAGVCVPISCLLNVGQPLFCIVCLI